MENPITLSVFGKLELNQGQKILLTAQLPLLIAAYVVIEYNGKATNRDDVFQLFFPQQADAPSEFSELATVIYQRLWAHLAQSPNTPTLWIAEDVLQQDIGQNLSDAIVQRAHGELQEFTLIERVTPEKQGFRYWADSRFQNYLKQKDGADRLQLVRKTFSEHISKLRSSAPQYVPTGKTGKAQQPLIINIPCTATFLKQALIDQNQEKIRELYTAPLLVNLEQDLRSDWWLSPKLRAWIELQRADFEHQVKTVLNTSHETLHPFQKDKNKMVQPSFVQTLVEGALPLYLRKHLLNKTNEECDITLQAIKSQWISSYVNVQRIGRWTDQHFNSRDPALLPLFLEKSYGFAVLLGDAGMGKSLVLCHFAQTLIQEARHSSEKPVPLLLHIADWAQRAWSFEDWLKYRLVRLGVGEKHLDTHLEHLLGTQQCLLLLDGFDNLPPLQRPFYLQRINHFVRKHGEAQLGGVILASRPEEYRIACRQLLEIAPSDDADFYFHTEALLLPLAHADAQAYLDEHTPLPPDATEHLLNIEGLREFLHIPLGLTLFTSAQQQTVLEADLRSPAQIKHDLVESYVEEQLSAHSSKESAYSPQQVSTWLAHIARYLNMGETLYLESLSPSRILNAAQQQRYQTDFAIAFGVIFGLMMGSIAGLIFGDRIAEQIPDIYQPPVTSGFFYQAHEIMRYWDKSGDWGDKFNLVVVYACIGIAISLMFSRVLFWLNGQINFALFLGGYLAVFMGFTGWLMDGAQWSFFTASFYGILGVVLGLMTDPVHTDPQTIALGQDARFTLERLFQDKRSLLLGLLFIPIGVGLMMAFRAVLPNLSVSLALLNGLAAGLSFTLGYLTYHSKSQQDWQNRVFFSTQKLQAAAKRSLSMILLIGGSITLFVTLIGLAHLDWQGSLSFGLRLGMPLGIIFGFLFYGGIEVLKHLVLRWVMYRENIAPLNYSAFLNYARHLGLLTSRSSGHAFRHDWFQEYFIEDKF